MIALSIGIFIGKIIFSAKYQSDKNILEEKLNTLKEQSQIEKLSFEKNLLQINTEKEQIRNEKEVANIQLAKKEADFDSLLEKNKVESINAIKNRIKNKKDWETSDSAPYSELNNLIKQLEK